MKDIQPEVKARPGAMVARLPFYWEPSPGIIAAFLVFVVAWYMNWGARREIFEVTRFEFLLGIILGITCIILLNYLPLNLRSAQKILISMGALLLAIVAQIPSCVSMSPITQPPPWK